MGQNWLTAPSRAQVSSARQIFTHTSKPLASRDRLVVRTLRCGRSNPGSNPGHGMQRLLLTTRVRTRVKTPHSYHGLYFYLGI